MGDYNRHSGDEDEDDDEERSGPMLGFLFGNVDVSGDLDEEYLDQDVKEHLSALAGQLRESLVDIKESGSLTDVSEEQEDYDRKADDAVDYEDIEEKYEGPEVQLRLQDEDAISQDQTFYAQAALERAPVSLGEDEDYDEEDNYEKEEGHFVEDLEDHQKLAEHPGENAVEVADEGISTLPENVKNLSSDTIDNDAAIVEEINYDISKDAALLDIPLKHDLPVLYEEDGKEVLRFSELFCQHELLLGHKTDKRQQKRRVLREKFPSIHHETLEEDESLLLKYYSTRINNTLGRVSDSEEAESDDSSKELSDDSMLSKPKSCGFRTSQPMKENADDSCMILESVHVPSPNFQLIHQGDWESAIIWDEGYCEKVREDHVDNAMDRSGSSEEVDTSTRKQGALCMKEREEFWQATLEFPNHDVTKSNMMWQASRPVVLEPLCQEKAGTQCVAEVRHPQLLRLETLPLKNIGDGGLRPKAQPDKITNVASYFKSLTLQSPEIQSENWWDNILWGEEKTSAVKHQRSKVIFNLQDDKMAFEILDGKDIPHSHAAAMVIMPKVRNHGNESGETYHLPSSLARFNISNDKYYMNKKNQQQQKSNFRKRTNHGIKVLHSTPSIKLQTMKPKLTNKDLANFHRPKAVWYPHHNEVAAKEQGILSVSGPMKIILKTMGGKGSRLIVDASETLESVKMKAARKFGDLRTSEKTKIFYCGKELQDNISLAQQEVRPNSILHLVRAKIHPWPKAQRLPGDSKPTRPPGAFKRKSDLSVKDGHVFIAEYCEERPLLLNNVGMGVRLCTYYRKVSATDSTAATLRNDRGSSIGMPVPLETLEDSPYLGDIRPGDTQTSIETNMFRAPAFHHKVQFTDFLLVRSGKGKLSLRRIDRTYAVGQQEPHMEVFSPSSKIVQTYLQNRFLVYLYREFRSNEKPGTLTRLRADEVMAQFPSLSDGFLRKRLRHCADFQRAFGGEMWIVMKPNFRIPSEEEIRRMLTPENVCAYESMQAGVYHLKRIGVSRLTQTTGLSAAMNKLPDEALVLAAASHIERELQITPWNLSSNFVSANMQGRRSLEKLEITGAGDPSGRGLGFSFLRVAPKPPGSTAVVEKKAAAARGGGAVTGTNADLRRLSMDAAREVLLKFNVAESQIDKLTRWHRIALVRKLSSEQAASGIKLGDSALNKFARGQRMSFLQLQQQLREKCQEIWDRQAQSLSVVDEENSESDGEANEDLDSFAGDLENLLEAEEGETEEVTSAKTKKEAIRGTGARRRALEAQREEDIEDEVAEAAELRRMLMEDDEADNVKKKKKVWVNEESDTVLKEQKPEPRDEARVGETKKKKIIKRIIRTKQADGTVISREILITDPKEVALYLARKNASQNGANFKEKKMLLSKKAKQVTFTKDGKKLKKPIKGEGGREGIHLICGACGRMGHMRTNKKVCPLYTEEGRANALKIENIDTGDVAQPSRQGIKITLKSSNGPVQEKEQASPLENSVVMPKITLKGAKAPAQEKEEPPVPTNNLVTPKITFKTVVGPIKEKEQLPSPATGIVTPRITLKISSGPAPAAVQEKEQSPLPMATPKPANNATVQKIPSLKIKLPFSGNIDSVPSSTNTVSEKSSLIKKIKLPIPSSFDAALPSTSKTVDSSVTPVSNVKNASADASKTMEGGQNILKKIKIPKRARSDFEVPLNEDMKIKNLDSASHCESPVRDKKGTLDIFGRDQMQRGSQMKTEADTEESDGHFRTTIPRKSAEEDILHSQSDGERMEKELFEVSSRREEKKIRREEKEKRKALAREEKKRRRAEEEKERQKEKENADAERRMLEWKMEEQLQKERLRKERQRLELEQQRETERAQRRRDVVETRPQMGRVYQWHEMERDMPRKETEREHNWPRERDIHRESNERERWQEETESEQEQEEIEWQHPSARKVPERDKQKIRKDRIASQGKRAARDKSSPYQERCTNAKRRASMEDDSQDNAPEYSHHHQNKRRKGGEVLLANILESVADILRKSDGSLLFLKPVTKKDAPDYLDVIKYPMDLSTIREKARKLTYKSGEEFRSDVWQIAKNAHIYNDNRNPGIPPLADRLVVICDKLLQERAYELAEAESTIERFDDHHQMYTAPSRATNRRSVQPY